MSPGSLLPCCSRAGTSEEAFRPDPKIFWISIGKGRGKWASSRLHGGKTGRMTKPRLGPHGGDFSGARPAFPGMTVRSAPSGAHAQRPSPRRWPRGPAARKSAISIDSPPKGDQCPVQKKGSCRGRRDRRPNPLDRRAHLIPAPECVRSIVTSSLCVPRLRTDACKS